MTGNATCVGLLKFLLENTSGRHNGSRTLKRMGGEYACEKNERRGSTNGARQSKGMDAGQWKIAPRISVQGFCGRLWKYDARGARRGVNESSSRMVQCLE